MFRCSHGRDRHDDASHDHLHARAEYCGIGSPKDACSRHASRAGVLPENRGRRTSPS